MQAGCDGALVVDPASVGFFRVQYDQASFDALAAQVAKLPDATRLKLQARRLGHGAWPTACSSTATSSWCEVRRRAAPGGLGAPSSATWPRSTRLALGEAGAPLVRRFMIDLVAPKFNKLGWEEKAGEPVEERQLRALMAGTLARAGDPARDREGERPLRALPGRSVQRQPVDDRFRPQRGGPLCRRSHLRRAGRARAAPPRATKNATASAAPWPRSAIRRWPARTLQLALSPQLAGADDHRSSCRPWPRNEHVDQAWDFAVANRDALMKDQDAVGQNRAFCRHCRAARPIRRHADMMEAYVKQNFGAGCAGRSPTRRQRACVPAPRKRQRLLPQVRAALE